MIEIKINDIERGRLLQHAEYTMYEKSHWGDGDVTIPEEQILYNKIKDAGDKLELSPNQFALLLNWIMDSTKHGTILMNEDVSVLNKIFDQLSHTYTIKRRAYTHELNTMEEQLDKIKSALKQSPIKKEDLEEVKKVVQEEVKENVKEDKLNSKIQKIQQSAKETKEIKDDITAQFKEERLQKDKNKIIDNLRSDKVKEKDQDKKKQSVSALDDKIQRAKELKEGIDKAEKFVKEVRKKTKGKKLL
ncbi:MAG: hypothetical protein KKH98_07110 [Spirochaetes bacterium]|nr:hypothetical protein [Spirochaetota bacterium]